MSLTISKKHFFLLIIQIIFVFLSLFILILKRGNSSQNFIFWSQYGTIICILLLILLCYFQKKIVTSLNLVFFAFCLFQFGIPILYAIDQDYNNFYMTLFSDQILEKAAIFSVISIQIFSIGVYLGMPWNDKKKKIRVLRKTSRKTFGERFEENRYIVSQAALILFIITGIVVIPLSLSAAIKSIASGSISIDFRRTLTSNAFLRFMQEFFFPSGLLYLCFSESKNIKKIIKSVYVFVAILMLLVADRNGGLTALAVIALYHTYYENIDERKNVKFSRKVQFIVLAFIILFLLIFISQARSGKVTSINMLYKNMLRYFVGELGFNFTTICFVMKYVPSHYPFQFGLSYIIAVLLLIPSSIDIFGFNNKFASKTGAVWLHNMNMASGNTFLAFGVGFSIIGEAYFNFAWAGVIPILLIGILVAKFLGENKRHSCQWSQYIHLVALLGMLTFPRRQFIEFLKSVEYSVVFMGLYLVIYIKILKYKGYVSKS